MTTLTQKNFLISFDQKRFLENYRQWGFIDQSSIVREALTLLMDLKKLAYVVWQCKYHIVWCPKYRFRILKGEVGKSVRDIIKQLCKWKKVEMGVRLILRDKLHVKWVVSIFMLTLCDKYTIFGHIWKHGASHLQ